MSMHKIEVYYKTPDGRTFTSEKEANAWCATLASPEQEAKIARAEKALSAQVTYGATPRDIIRWLARNWESL